MNVEDLKKSLIDKTENKSTTSKKFKSDLIDNFAHENSKDYTCLEVGTHWGYTTNVLSHLFKDVITIEGVSENVEKAIDINNLAGKYRALYGTPFDLEELSDYQAINIDSITHIRVIDVVGSIKEKYIN